MTQYNTLNVKLKPGIKNSTEVNFIECCWWLH